MIAERNSLANRDELARALATAVSAALSRCITLNGKAVLAVSGGNTPGLFLAHLSTAEISWEMVTITLVDERQVDETSPRSNARLVKQGLLRNRAKDARLVALHKNTAAASKLDLDVVVLGMGEDGHTASFFPGGDNLAKALDPACDCALMTIDAPGAGESRLTFTLPRLLAADRLFLHIEGSKKLAVLEEALAGHDAMAMPIRAVLHSAKPLRLYWCP